MKWAIGDIAGIQERETAMTLVLRPWQSNPTTACDILRHYTNTRTMTQSMVDDTIRDKSYEQQFTEKKQITICFKTEIVSSFC